MSAKNFQRVTFSFPKTTILRLEMAIPKNKRSKFIANLIEKNLEPERNLTLEDIDRLITNITNKSSRKTKKSAVQLQREARLMH
jgi:metal-responsive CopG/Arc/MetJ family transcriptional regulator